MAFENSPVQIERLGAILFLFALTVLTAWLAYKSLQAPLNIVEPTDHPDSYMTNIAGTQMNASTGQPQDQLFTPQMVHYAQDDTTDFTTPHFIIYSDSSGVISGEPWNIYADKGQAKNGFTTLQLQDNVKLIQKAGPNNAASTITTPTLTIYPKEQYAETHAPVVATQPGSIVHAVGARAYLKTGEIELLSKAHGSYDAKAAGKNDE